MVMRSQMVERDPVRFRRRVVGHVPGEGVCHSQIELSTDARYLLLHLASTARFSVALLRKPAVRLLGVLAEPTECRIAVWHGTVENWLMVRPHRDKGELPLMHRSGAPAVELSLSAGRDQHLRLVFPGEDLCELRRHLTAAYLQLEGP